MIKKNLAGTVLAAILVCTVFTACSSDEDPMDQSSVSSTLSSTVSDPVNEPTDTPDATDAPEMTPGNGTNAAIGINSFRDTLRDVYGDKYYPDTEMSEEQIREELGLTEDMYEEVYAENTAQKAHPDTFIAVKVKEGQHDAVKEKLEAYKQRLTEDEDFSANADKLGAAKVYGEGDYVFLVLLGDVEDSESSEGMAEAFGKEVQKGIDAIQDALGIE